MTKQIFQSWNRALYSAILHWFSLTWIILYDNNLPLWGGQNTGSVLSGVQSQLSEEGQCTGNKFMEGTMSYGTDEPKDYGTALNTNNTQPSTNWGKIRQMNTFIQSVEDSPLPDYTKRKFIAQAKFFRAFRYWDLVRIYGGVPLVLTPLDGVGKQREIRHCYQEIKHRNVLRKWLLILIMQLPIFRVNGLQQHDWGKITKGAAAAFKGRVLLYWASPMFNPN